MFDFIVLFGSYDGDVGLFGYVGGWMVYGYFGYQGYVWYWCIVDVFVGDCVWEVFGFIVLDDGYEFYWNGVWLGGLGCFGMVLCVVGVCLLCYVLFVNVVGYCGVFVICVYM